MMQKVNLFGPKAKFEHIGLAVKSIESVIPNEVNIIIDEIQKVKIAFVEIHGIKIEILESINKADSPIYNRLCKGQVIQHISYKVDDLDEAVICAKKNGFSQISLPVEAPALNNKKIIWLFSNHFGLVELIES